jgi:hypothetical protein
MSRAVNFMDRRVDGEGVKTPLLVIVCMLAVVSLGALDRSPPEIGSELDRDGDGKVDYRVYYDERGGVAREEMDFDYDGTMDTFYFYQAGVLQRQEIDSNRDGKVDLWVYLLDGSYVKRYERDTDGDGKPDMARDFGGK